MNPQMEVGGRIRLTNEEFLNVMGIVDTPVQSRASPDIVDPDLSSDGRSLTTLGDERDKDGQSRLYDSPTGPCVYLYIASTGRRVVEVNLPVPASAVHSAAAR